MSSLFQPQYASASCNFGGSPLASPPLSSALFVLRRIRSLDFLSSSQQVPRLCLTVLVVWKLDRLSRSLKDLLTIMERIDQLGAGFCSLTEAIDTTTPAGRMMMQMVGSFAEFERAMIRERTKAGMESARKQGRIGGRRSKLEIRQQQEIVTMVMTGQKTAAEAARLFKVHPATVSRLLALQSGSAKKLIASP